MSEQSEGLIGQTQDLIESIKRLRNALLDYQQGCERLLKAGELGRKAISTMERVELANFADRRERLAIALKDFETSRRVARLGLIAVAEEEGSNVSEVARTLRVSRQLLSRQWIESKTDQDQD